MLTQREAVSLLRSASAGAWFAAAQMGLVFSVAPGVSAATPRVLFESAAHSQTPQTLAVPADSPRWDLQGQAKATEYQGRKCLFLNGGFLFRGRSAQYFRDPGFLGITNPENDAVYLPLKKGRNELLLALSELGGGWGFICRLADLKDVAHAGCRCQARCSMNSLPHADHNSTGTHLTFGGKENISRPLMLSENMPATTDSQDLSVEMRASIFNPYLGKSK